MRSVALWPSSSIIFNAGVTRSDYPYLDPNSVILLLEGTVESGKRTKSILRIQSHVIGRAIFGPNKWASLSPIGLRTSNVD